MLLGYCFRSKALLPPFCHPLSSVNSTSQTAGPPRITMRGPGNSMCYQRRAYAILLYQAKSHTWLPPLTWWNDPDSLSLDSFFGAVDEDSNTPDLKSWFGLCQTPMPSIKQGWDGYWLIGSLGGGTHYVWQMDQGLVPELYERDLAKILATYRLYQRVLEELHWANALALWSVENQIILLHGYVALHLNLRWSSLYDGKSHSDLVFFLNGLESIYTTSRMMCLKGFFFSFSFSFFSIS